MERAHEDAGRDQQHDRERHLRDDQHLTQAGAVPRAGGARGVGLQRGRDVGAHRLQRGYQAEADGREHRHREREQPHAVVRPEIDHEGERVPAHEQREQLAVLQLAIAILDDAAHQRQQQALGGSNPTHQVRAARTRIDRRTASSRSRARWGAPAAGRRRRAPRWEHGGGKDQQHVKRPMESSGTRPSRAKAAGPKLQLGAPPSHAPGSGSVRRYCWNCASAAASACASVVPGASRAKTILDAANMARGGATSPADPAESRRASGPPARSGEAQLGVPCCGSRQ